MQLLTALSDLLLTWKNRCSLVCYTGVCVKDALWILLLCVSLYATPNIDCLTQSFMSKPKCRKYYIYNICEIQWRLTTIVRIISVWSIFLCVLLVLDFSSLINHYLPEHYRWSLLLVLLAAILDCLVRCNFVSNIANVLRQFIRFGMKQILKLPKICFTYCPFTMFTVCFIHCR